MENEPLRWEWIAKLPAFARNLLHKGQGRNFQFAQMECNTMRAKWQVADKAAGTDFHRCHVCTWSAPSGSPGSASQMTRMDICCWRFLSWLSCWRFAIPSSWWATLEVPWRKTCHESPWMNVLFLRNFGHSARRGAVLSSCQASSHSCGRCWRVPRPRRVTKPPWWTSAPKPSLPMSCQLTAQKIESVESHHNVAFQGYAGVVLQSRSQKVIWKKSKLVVDRWRESITCCF